VNEKSEWAHFFENLSDKIYQERSLPKNDTNIYCSNIERVTKPILWAMEHFNPSVDDLVGFYNWSMKEVLEHHAPLRTRIFKGRRRPKWFSSELILSRRAK
jgi:hypothetical protein